MGIDALGRLIKTSPEIAEQHQLAVIDCLEVRKIILSNAHEITVVWVVKLLELLMVHVSFPVFFLLFCLSQFRLCHFNGPCQFGPVFFLLFIQLLGI